jgi:putative transposase
LQNGLRPTTCFARLFRCRPYRRTCNERTGTRFNHLRVPTDIALVVVLWRLRYKLSLPDLAEMFLTCGITCTHETAREWEERFAPLLTEHLRAKRRGKAGITCHAAYPTVQLAGRQPPRWKTWCWTVRRWDSVQAKVMPRSDAQDGVGTTSVSVRCRMEIPPWLRYSA